MTALYEKIAKLPPSLLPKVERFVDMLLSIDAQVREAIELMQKETKHHAHRTWPMLEKYGAIEMLDQLMDNTTAQSGFKALRNAKLLDKTFESIIIRYNDADIFSRNSIEVAQWRLENADKLID